MSPRLPLLFACLLLTLALPPSARADACGCDSGDVRIPLVLRQYSYFAGTQHSTVEVDGSVIAAFSYSAGSVVPDPERPGQYRAISYSCGGWADTVVARLHPRQVLTVRTEWNEDRGSADYTEPADPRPAGMPSDILTVLDWPRETCVKLYISFDGGGAWVPFENGGSFVVPSRSSPFVTHLMVDFGEEDHRPGGETEGPMAGATRSRPAEYVVDETIEICVSAQAASLETFSLEAAPGEDGESKAGKGGFKHLMVRPKKGPPAERPLRDAYRGNAGKPVPPGLLRARASGEASAPIKIPNLAEMGPPHDQITRRAPGRPAPAGAARGSSQSFETVALADAESTMAAAVTPGELLRRSIGAVRMRLSVGADAGDLIYEVPLIDGRAYAPSALRLVGRGAAPRLVRQDASGAIRQILADTTAIDVITLSPSSFQVRYYNYDQVTPTDDGFTVTSDNPQTVWTIENPDEEPSGRIRFTQQRGSTTIVHEATWRAGGASDEGAMTISYHGGTVVETRTYFIGTTGTALYRGERIQRRRGPAGPVESDVYEAYQEFYNWGAEGEVFEDVVYRVEGVDETAPRVTEWTYADDGFIRGRVVTSVIHPDGYWERYAYYQDGELWQKLSPWRDSPAHPSLVNASYTNCRRQVVSYAPGATATDVWRFDEEYAPNFSNLSSPVLIGRSETLESYPSSGGYREDTWTLLDAAEYVQSTQVFTQRGGELVLDVRADGSSTRYRREWGYWIPGQGAFSYTSGDTGTPAQRIVAYEGHAGALLGVANETLISHRVQDAAGRPYFEEVFVHDGSQYLPGLRMNDWISRETYQYNNDGQLVTVERDGALVREISYDLLGRPWRIVDESGVVEETEYDSLGRVSGRTTSAGDAVPTQRTDYSYDANGRVVEETVTAGSDAGTRTTTVHYDTAGRLIARTTPDNLTHRFAERFLVDGGGNVVRRETTEIRPDLSEVVTEFHQDRRLFRQVGATPPVYHGYATANYSGGPGIYSSVWGYPVVANFRDAGATQLRGTTWFNWLNAAVRQIRTGPGPVSYVQDFYFDTTKGGQLGASYHAVNTGSGYALVGQAPRLFEYDSFGRLVREGYDYSAPYNWILDSGGRDPIIGTTERYELASDGNWYRVRQKHQWQTYDSTSTTLIEETREQLSGLSGGVVAQVESLASGGRRTTTTVTVDRATAQRTTTVREHSMDASAPLSVMVESGGRLVSRRSAAASADTVFSYHPLGEVETVVDPVFGTTTYGYTPGGQLEQVTDQLGRVTTITYQPAGQAGAGQRASITDAAGVTTYYAYDSRGRLWRQWGANTYPQSFGYDDDDRLTHLRTYRSSGGADSEAVDWSSATWPDNAPPGDATEWVFHFGGMLQRKIYADGSSVNFLYDNIGRPRTRTNARGQITSYAYDLSASGRLREVIYPANSGTTNVSLGYDRTMRLATVTDASGTRTLSYAPTGGLADERYTSGLLAGHETSRKYHSDGRLDELLVPGAYTARWGYDGFSRPEQLVRGAEGLLPLAVTYQYAAGSGLLEGTEWSVAGERRQHTLRIHDDLARLERIQTTGGDGAVYRSFHYADFDPLNRRKRVEREDQSRWHYDYNARGELELAQRLPASADSGFGDTFSYEYDSIGNRRSSAEGGAASIYTSNLLNQYVERTVPGEVKVRGEAPPDAHVTANFEPLQRAGEAFKGSLAVDNSEAPVWTEIDVVAVQNEAGPAGEDAVATVTRSAFIPRTPEVYSYDADGNLTGDGRWVYSWDVENRLIACETQPAAAAAGLPRQRLEFVYDAGWRRVAKRVLVWDAVHGGWRAESELRFLYDGWNLVAELAVTPEGLNVLRTHLWGLDLSGSTQGAGGVGGLLATTTTTDTYLPWYDGTANIVGYVGVAGGDFARIEYDPFGEAYIDWGETATHFRFSSRYHDKEASLIYYGFRYYSPEKGRWLSRDPLEEVGGINMYAFVQNAPTQFVDKLGLLLAAVDGTGSWTWRSYNRKTMQWNSHVRNFFMDYQGPGPRQYWDGPANEISGSDSSSIHKEVIDWICSELSKNPSEPINLVGHSRGGYIVMQVAKELKEEGCGCTSGAAKSTTVRVNFLGVYDPVDMVLGYGEGQKVSSNVDHGAVALGDPRIGSRPYFNTAEGTAEDVTKMTSYEQEIFDATHGGMGGDPWGGDHPRLMTEKRDRAGSAAADAWMRQRARSAGIQLRGTP